MLSIDLNIGDVVLENGGDVDLGTNLSVKVDVDKRVADLGEGAFGEL